MQLFKKLNHLYDWLFDTRLGVNTAGKHPSGYSSKHNDNVECNPTSYRLLRKIFRYLDIKQSDNEVFVDYGCGKGRVVCFAAQYPFKSVNGVEISPIWSNIAETNVKNLRAKICTEVKISTQDAIGYDCSQGTVYYFFNPFGENTFREVLQRIKQSLNNHQRTVRIVYFNAVQKSVLDDQEWLQMVGVIH